MLHGQRRPRPPARRDHHRQLPPSIGPRRPSGVPRLRLPVPRRTIVVGVRANSNSSESIHNLCVNAGELPAAHRSGCPASILATGPKHESNTRTLLHRRVKPLSPELGLTDPSGKKEARLGNFRRRRHVIAHLPRYTPNIPRYQAWPWHSRNHEPALQSHRPIRLTHRSFPWQCKLGGVCNPHPGTKYESVPPRIPCSSQAPNNPFLRSVLPEPVQLTRGQCRDGLTRHVKIPHAEPRFAVQSPAMGQSIVAVEVHPSVVLERPRVLQRLVHCLQCGHRALPCTTGAVVADGAADHLLQRKLRSTEYLRLPTNMHVPSVDDHITPRLALLPIVQHLQQPHQIVDVTVGELSFAIVDYLRPDPCHRRRKQHRRNRRAEHHKRAIIPLLQRGFHHRPLLGTHQSRVTVHLILRTPEAPRPSAIQKDGTDVPPANRESFVVEHLDMCVHLDVLPKQSLVLVIHLQPQDTDPKLGCDWLPGPLERPISKVVHNVVVVVEHQVAGVCQGTPGVGMGPGLTVTTPIFLDNLLPVGLPLPGILRVAVQHKLCVLAPVRHTLP
mmetsp:Transcript_75656/g.202298  ORF Transcript_75656/g.202298 Transcript_75656/m.202298 type:complete len:555 (+) Transcript_75656:549-2213(+)